MKSANQGVLGWDKISLENKGLFSALTKNLAAYNRGRSAAWKLRGVGKRHWAEFLALMGKREMFALVDEHLTMD